LVHPQMSVYGLVLVGFLEGERRLLRRGRAVPVLALALPFLWGFHPAAGAAREALLSRTFFFLDKWAWYEWLGVVAPLAILWRFSVRPPAATSFAFRRVARTLVAYGLAFTAGGLLLTFVRPLENFTRLQPMRSFHLIYMIFFVLLGGVLGEQVLGRKIWRWVAVFAPMAAGMWVLQAASFPFSPHVEWPGSDGGNPWVSAFLWVRSHTPKDAVFALDPNYMAVAGDDQHGFRAVAERAALADAVKDSGAVSLFPQLADEWKAEVTAQSGWRHFGYADFQRLASEYPVRWIVTYRPAPAGLTCPYQNRDLSVCRIGKP
jgi:hypothetical protein